MMLVTETFHGYIETTQDVLLIFEGCRRGLLPRVCRRLQERERKLVRSGAIFVFDERESGIKRWTDGRVWSPSRILGNFLIYREIDKKPNDKRLSYGEPSRRSFDANIDKSKERQLVGSLSDSYKFREDGLIKKTMSIIVNGVAQHLISYYDPNEVLEEKLRAPSSVPELASLEISPELLVKQNFRIPPMVEPTMDDGRHRSMSVGSIKYDYYPAMYPPPPPPPPPPLNTANNTTSKDLYHLDPIPPSSSTSSPNPTTSRYNHQRNTSLPRFDPRHYTSDLRQRYGEERSSPNLGRLLNPVNNTDLILNPYQFQSTQQNYLLYNNNNNRTNQPIIYTSQSNQPQQDQYLH